MNIFEKYIDNEKQNKELTKIIDNLCKLHFLNISPTLEDIFGYKFIKFLRWEIDIEKCPPHMINMYYIGEDNKTKEQEELCKCIEWNNLLIKLDNYD